MTPDNQTQYRQLSARLADVSAKLSTPLGRKDFLALCEEYDQLMQQLDQLNPRGENMTTPNIDERYAINLEYCGYTERKWVLRFCLKWIGAFDTRKQAYNRAVEYETKRLKLDQLNPEVQSCKQ